MKTPQTLTTSQVLHLLSALRYPPSANSPSPRATRNWAMATLMLECGLRVGELIRLSQLNLYQAGYPVHTLYIDASVAKGSRPRYVPISLLARQAILLLRNIVWQGDPTSYLRYAFYCNNPSRHLSTRQVERIIRSAALRSIGRPVHPHILRHTFASRLMRVANARVVQQLLGHAHIATTQIYMHPNQDDLKSAIDAVSSPSLELSPNIPTRSTTNPLPDSSDTPRANKHGT